MSGPEIIVVELMPNLLPYLAATLVNAVSAAILASIGLEVLGLGPIDSPDPGHDALLGQLQRGASSTAGGGGGRRPSSSSSWSSSACSSSAMGLDEIANPRLRRAI